MMDLMGWFDNGRASWDGYISVKLGEKQQQQQAHKQWLTSVTDYL